jgi:MFS family permease
MINTFPGFRWFARDTGQPSVSTTEYATGATPPTSRDGPQLTGCWKAKTNTAAVEGDLTDTGIDELSEYRASRRRVSEKRDTERASTANATENSADADSAYTDSEVRTISLAIIAGVFFGGLATGVAFPTLPLLDRILGISAVVLGIILSANRITRLLMNAPAGNLIDSIGTRKPMIVGLFVQGLAPFGYVLGLYVPAGTFLVLPVVGAVSNAAVVFLLARGLWGVGSAFVVTGAFATITMVTTTTNRGRWLGYMRGGQSLGFPTGLVVGGIVADLVSFQTAFLLAGGLAMLAGIIAVFVLPAVRADTDSQARLRDIPAMIRREPRIFPLGVGNMTIRFVFSGVLLATVVKYASAYGIEFSLLSAAGISGLVLGGGVLASSAATVASGRVSDRLSNRAVVTVPAFASMAVGLVTLAVFPTLGGLFAGVALIGLGNGAIGPALMAIVGDITPNTGVGRMGGVYNIMGDVGFTLGPLLAVPMVDVWLGFRATYLICAAVVVVTLVVVAVPLLGNGAMLPAETRSQRGD